MKPRTVVTVTYIRNAAYPKLHVHWTEDDDSNGWTGTARVWKSPNASSGTDHTLHLRQTLPLGAIDLTVDECSHGGWMSTKFEGVGLTERDLQWAAAFATAALKTKPDSDIG